MTAISFEADLLRCYDQAGSRFALYPRPQQFTETFDAAAARDQIERSNEDPLPSRLSLYLRVPFRTNPGFHRHRTRTITCDHNPGEAYLLRLLREISFIAPLFDRDRDVIQLYLGGGTLNFLSVQQLATLMESLACQFHFSSRADRDFSIELDPRSATSEDVAQLVALGFNHVSLSVRPVNPIHSARQISAVIDACRAHGLKTINVNLTYGLPRQTLVGFAKTLDAVVTAAPDRLAVYGYSHLPEACRTQCQMDAAEPSSGEDRVALLRLAVDRLGAVGYEHIGLGHFALPGDELTHARSGGQLHCNFMGYTTHVQTDLVGFGPGAISRVGDSYWQNQNDVCGWEAAVDAGRSPVSCGRALSAEDLLREDVILQLLCAGRINIERTERRHQVDFPGHFKAELKQLAALCEQGLVRISPHAVETTSRGRLLLRIIAACFDAHLQQPAHPSVPADFSRTI